MPRRVVLLDRDGTINVDDGYVYRTEDFHLIPQAPEAIQRLRDWGASIGVVTNQSGVAAGLYSAGDVKVLHDFMHDQLRDHGTWVDAVAFCLHSQDDDCDCRKPRIGMAKQIEQQLGEPIDFSSSWMIGDKPSDIEFGNRLGTHTALIRSRYWNSNELSVEPDLIVNSLYEAARLIATSRSE